MGRFAFAAVTLASFAGSAFGVVTPIGPFVGGASEGFETFPAGDVLPGGTGAAGPASILGGIGTLTGSTTHSGNPLYVWSSIGGLSLGTFGSAVPHDGIRGLVLEPYGSPYNARIDFAQPVQDFGGYWAHASYQGNAGPVSLTFYDAGGGVIGTDSFHYPGTTLAGVLEWHGWTSTTPIKAVEWTGYWATVDGLQIDVPAPGAGFVVAGAALLALRRRRG